MDSLEKYSYVGLGSINPNAEAIQVRGGRGEVKNENIKNINSLMMSFSYLIHFKDFIFIQL